MRIVFFVLSVSALSSAFAVSQAELVWKKPIEAHTKGPAKGPFILPDGKMAVVAENQLPGDKPTAQIVLTIVDREGNITRTMMIGGADVGGAHLGGAVCDRTGKIHILAKMDKGNTVRLYRYSATGDEELAQDLKGEDGAFPTGLLVERSGDLLFTGVNPGVGLGYLARTDDNGQVAWHKAHGKLMADAFRPADMDSDQRGDVVFAGMSEGVARVVKMDAKGNESFAVDLEGVKDVVRTLIDPDGNVDVLCRATEGGVLLWSLDGKDGHVLWVEDKLKTAAIDPQDALMDARRFLYVLVNNTEEGKTRSFLVRYSLGGTPINNLRPLEEGNLGSTLAMDSEGEIYLTAISGRGEMVAGRAAPNLVLRYAVRSSPNGYTGARIAVRDQDGAIALLAMKKDEQGDLSQPFLFRGRQAPVAKFDTYKAAANTSNTLTSVLANDQYIDGAEMSITQGAANGRVEMNQDGTFTYTPKSGFTGKDTFRYQLRRGTLFWYAAVVTLNVE